MATERRALVVGGSGYLGQHLVDVLPRVHGWTCHYTYRDNALPADPSRVGHRADAITGEGMREAVRAALGADRSPTAPAPRALLVVNCAATSSPAACERDPASALATNVPTALLDALDAAWSAGELGTSRPLLVHLSTDQVYGGDDAMSVEATHPPRPVNAYARSKTKAEAIVRERWPEHVILRSSIITGADAPIRPVNRPLFLDFILGALRGDQPVTFFRDEWRCPVAARDIAAHVVALASSPRWFDASETSNEKRTFNMGGPDRVSRVDMARITARVFGLSDANVVEAASASVERPAPSPADISMRSEALERETGVRAMTFEAQARAAKDAMDAVA